MTAKNFMRKKPRMAKRSFLTRKTRKRASMKAKPYRTEKSSWTEKNRSLKRKSSLMTKKSSLMKERNFLKMMKKFWMILTVFLTTAEHRIWMRNSV